MRIYLDSKFMFGFFGFFFSGYVDEDDDGVDECDDEEV